jgi:hypothetical protein
MFEEDQVEFDGNESLDISMDGIEGLGLCNAGLQGLGSLGRVFGNDRVPFVIAGCAKVRQLGKNTTCKLLEVGKSFSGEERKRRLFAKAQKGRPGGEGEVVDFIVEQGYVGLCGDVILVI